MKTLQLFALLAITLGGRAAEELPAEVALCYVTAADALTAIKQKLGTTAAGAIANVDEKRNVLVVNWAHNEAVSVRTFLSTLDQRPSGGDWLTIETRGVRVDLPPEWRSVSEQPTFFIQRRARHPEHRIEMSAGAFKLDFTVEEYAGVVASCFTTNAEEQLDHLVKRLRSTRADIGAAVTSRAGRRIAEHVAQASPSARFELIDVYHQNITGGRQYDIRSKTSRSSDPILYRRDFVLAGVAPNELVHVTCVGPSEQVFTNRGIIRSIRKERDPKRQNDVKTK